MKPTPPLTAREWRVLLLVLLHDKAAADELQISVSTLRNHWREIYRKTGCHSRPAAAAWLLLSDRCPLGLRID